MRLCCTVTLSSGLTQSSISPYLPRFVICPKPRWRCSSVFIFRAVYFIFISPDHFSPFNVFSRAKDNNSIIFYDIKTTFLLLHPFLLFQLPLPLSCLPLCSLNFNVLYLPPTTSFLKLVFHPLLALVQNFFLLFLFSSSFIFSLAHTVDVFKRAGEL